MIIGTLKTGEPVIHDRPGALMCIRCQEPLAAEHLIQTPPERAFLVWLTPPARLISRWALADKTGGEACPCLPHAEKGERR